MPDEKDIVTLTPFDPSINPSLYKNSNIPYYMKTKQDAPDHNYANAKKPVKKFKRFTEAQEQIAKVNKEKKLWKEKPHKVPKGMFKPSRNRSF